jgi:hypothetical protein
MAILEIPHYGSMHGRALMLTPAPEVSRRLPGGPVGNGIAKAGVRPTYVRSNGILALRYVGVTDAFLLRNSRPALSSSSGLKAVPCRERPALLNSSTPTRNSLASRLLCRHSYEAAKARFPDLLPTIMGSVEYANLKPSSKKLYRYRWNHSGKSTATNQYRP